MDKMIHKPARAVNAPINIYVCVTKVIKPLMIISPVILMITIVLIKVNIILIFVFLLEDIQFRFPVAITR